MVSETYGACDAPEDVPALSKVLDAAGITKEDIQKHGFSLKAVCFQKRFTAEKSKNLPLLHPLLANGVLKMPTA